MEVHPLNAPELDSRRGVVTAGHAILSPRIGTALSSVHRSDFSRIFAGLGGTDPYGGACSELYMDFFGRSAFPGKGIVDIDAYLAREVLPYNPDAWIDKSKTKVGYEIPFTRVFYVYKELEKADDIAARIESHEHILMDKLHILFGKEK